MRRLGFGSRSLGMIVARTGLADIVVGLRIGNFVAARFLEIGRLVLVAFGLFALGFENNLVELGCIVVCLMELGLEVLAEVQIDLENMLNLIVPLEEFANPDLVEDR